MPGNMAKPRKTGVSKWRLPKPLGVRFKTKYWIEFLLPIELISLSGTKASFVTPQYIKCIILLRFLTKAVATSSLSNHTSTHLLAIGGSKIHKVFWWISLQACPISFLFTIGHVRFQNPSWFRNVVSRYPFSNLKIQIFSKFIKINLCNPIFNLYHVRIYVS